MARDFPYGFKAEADRIALENRAEIELDAFARLDPLKLAKFLLVPVCSLNDLEGVARDAVRHFTHGPGRGEFSAATVFVTRFKKIILVNPGHSDGRQSSSVAHELAHIILGHESEAPVGGDGTREWNPAQEKEADWLGGCLLIPTKAAFAAAGRSETDEEVAEQFGTSVPFAKWRMNASGARFVSARKTGAARRPTARR